MLNLRLFVLILFFALLIIMLSNYGFSICCKLFLLMLPRNVSSLKWLGALAVLCFAFKWDEFYLWLNTLGAYAHVVIVTWSTTVIGPQQFFVFFFPFFFTGRRGKDRVQSVFTVSLALCVCVCVWAFQIYFFILPLLGSSTANTVVRFLLGDIQIIFHSDETCFLFKY